MESTRDIKGRIKSVTNIQQITKAMKMVAAARLRKAEEKANGSRPYAEKIGELLRRASSVTPGFTSHLLATAISLSALIKALPALITPTL